MPDHPSNTSPKSPPSPPPKSTTPFQPSPYFWASRKKGPSLSGTLVWVALRTLDIPLQYHLLRSKSSLPATPSPSTPKRILNLNSYHTLVLILAVGSSAKQIYWKLLIGDTVMPAPMCAFIAIYNSLLNSLNTLFALSQTSQTSSLCLPIGSLLYTTGLSVEWTSEIQRQNFKSDPQNRDKPFSDGLFGLARNVNYGGYAMWRSGYALVCGGWVWAAVTGSWLMWDFVRRAVPSMDAYCEKRVSPTFSSSPPWCC